MSDLIRVPYGTHAGCGDCPLVMACSGPSGRPVHGIRPRSWKPSGLMVISEQPTDVDRSRGKPLSGADGRLFDALCEAAGVSRDEVWLTHAVLGRMSKKQRKGTKRDIKLIRQEAIYHCGPRLDAEIAEAQPRVIVTLGDAGLEAATSHTVIKTKLQPFACSEPDCVDVKGKARHLRGLGIKCAMGDCDWLAVSDYTSDDDKALVSAWGDALKAEHNSLCPVCSSSIKKLRPKRIKCPTCKGLRRKTVEVQSQACAWSLHGRDGIVGAVFNAEASPARWDEFGVKYVIPTYAMRYCLGPAQRGGGQYAARVVVEHLTKASRLLHTDRSFRASAVILSEPQDVEAWLAEPGTYAVDIETDSREGAWSATAITCIGFSRSDREQALVVDSSGWDAETESKTMDAVCAFLEDEDTARGKVLHNGAFDRVVIARLWGVDCNAVTGDTLIGHHVCYPDEEHGLGFVAHELLDAPPWKGGVVRKSWGRQGDKDALSGYADFEGLAHYNAQDTRATALAWDTLNAPGGRVDAAQTRPVLELDTKMSNIAVAMELTGLHIDEERMAAVDEAHVKICEAELGKMRELVSRDDWSPTGGDLQWALFANDGPCQLSPVSHTETGQPSMDKAALNAMVDVHPLIPSLLRWRKYSYALSHYLRGKGLQRDRWGYIHPTWKVYGARTGRWSSSPNMQNWTKGDHVDELTNMRRMVVAPPSYKIVGADFSQLEMRVVAALSQDENFIRRCLDADEQDKLNPEADPHSYVASLTFGDTFLEADKTRRKTLRDVAKRVFYGLQYGAGAETVLAAIYDGGYDGPPLSVQVIRATIETIFRTFPGIKTWREGSVREVMEAREIRSPILGRRRVYPLGEVDTTICYNFPIQSGAADIVNMQMDVLNNRLAAELPNAAIFAQVHDAIYAEVPEDQAERCAVIFEESLNVERALIEGGPVMPFAASAKISDRWDTAA